MISHIHSATIIVTDIDRAVDFYVNKLGFEITVDAQPAPEMRFVTVNPQGAITGLALGQASWFDGARTAGGHSGFNFSTRDIDATYADLVAKGVEFTGPVQTEAWGQKTAWMLDPDGNVIYLVEEMSFPVGA